jgi:hypothetical protein
VVGVLDGDGEGSYSCGAYGKMFHRLRCCFSWALISSDISCVLPELLGWAADVSSFVEAGDSDESAA